MRFVVSIHPSMLLQEYEDLILEALLNYFWVPMGENGFGNYYMEEVESVKRISFTDFVVQLGNPVWEYAVWNDSTYKHELWDFDRGIRCEDICWSNEIGARESNYETIKDQIHEALLIGLKPEYDTDINVEINNEMRETTCDRQ